MAKRSRRYSIPSTVLVDGQRLSRDTVMADAVEGLSWDLVYQRLARDGMTYDRATQTPMGESRGQHWLAESLVREVAPYFFHKGASL